MEPCFHVCVLILEEHVIRPIQYTLPALPAAVPPGCRNWLKTKQILPGLTLETAAFQVLRK